MWDLHKRDPNLWSVDKIARTFGLPRPRVKALLLFARVESEVYPDGEWLVFFYCLHGFLTATNNNDKKT